MRLLRDAVGPTWVAAAAYEALAWVTGWPTWSDLAARGGPARLAVAVGFIALGSALVWHFAEQQGPSKLRWHNFERRCCVLEGL